MYRFPVIVEPTATTRHTPRTLPSMRGHRSDPWEAEERMDEAIGFHIAGLEEDGFPVPRSRSSAIYVAVNRG